MKNLEGIPMLRAALSFTGAVALSFSLVGCSSTQAPKPMPKGQAEFSQYAEETRNYLAENRHFVYKDHSLELGFHSPREFVPKEPNGAGILLIHGLGDSPWTFTDLGQTLADEGFLVHTILLDGHGTKPADMLKLKSKEWEDRVDEQAALLKKECSTVFVGGFSTGGNLALEYAYRDADVAGLLLFSPAVELRTGLIALAPIVGTFINWLRTPDEKTEGVTPFRYSTIPLDGLSAFYDTMKGAQKALAEKPLDKPVIVVFSQHDSIVDTQKLIAEFPKLMKNPDSKFIWYGTDAPENAKDDPRILVKTDFIPEKRIGSFAHMSMSYSPRNEWYGENGKYRTCRNSMSEEDFKKCKEAPEVWYSAWGMMPEGHVSARLTFNPYYDWQAGQISDALKKALAQKQIRETVRKVP